MPRPFLLLVKLSDCSRPSRAFSTDASDCSGDFAVTSGDVTGLMPGQ